MGSDACGNWQGICGPFCSNDLPPSPEKKISKPKHTRLKFDLHKPKDPNVLETFQAMIGGRFALLTIMSNEDTDIDSMITTFNTAVIDTASKILGKHQHKPYPRHQKPL